MSEGSRLDSLVDWLMVPIGMVMFLVLGVRWWISHWRDEAEGSRK